MAVLILFIALCMVGWKWHLASSLAASEQRKSELSWAFADGVLKDLNNTRIDVSRLESERGALLLSLDENRRKNTALEAALASWQQSHHQIETQSQQALSQWSSFSQELQQNLGSTRNQLAETASTLTQERQTAAQSIAQLDSEKNQIAEQKNAVEREADALSRKAQSLNYERNQLENDLGHARSSIQSLESDRRSLESRNSQLCNEISNMRSTICSLQNSNSQLSSRISCLENELSRARSDNNDKKQR